MKSDSDGDIEVQIQMEEINTAEKEFIEGVYDIICRKMKRNFLYKSDFLYDVIPTLQNKYYWLDQNHPIACLLKENEQIYKGPPETAYFAGPYGNVVVYEENAIYGCVELLVETCKTYHLEIKE